MVGGNLCAKRAWCSPPSGRRCREAGIPLARPRGEALGIRILPEPALAHCPGVLAPASCPGDKSLHRTACAIALPSRFALPDLWRDARATCLCAGGRLSGRWLFRGSKCRFLANTGSDPCNSQFISNSPDVLHKSINLKPFRAVSEVDSHVSEQAAEQLLTSAFP